jgi:hypothetical protein
MGLSNKAAKMLTNKYFLYFTVFLATITVFGYLAMNRLNALIVFSLVGILSYQFIKNMGVVLLICILATNLLMSSKIIREGLENASDSTDSVPSNTTETNNSNNSKKLPPATSSLNQSDNPITPPHMGTDESNVTADTSTSEQAPAPAPAPLEGMNGGKNQKNGSGNRIDYASTLEEAYDNLDQILGSDGIKNLTQDTHKLMSKQQELFKSMEAMAPMLESAQNMLQGFDMNSLKNLTGLASSFTNASGKP